MAIPNGSVGLGLPRAPISCSSPSRRCRRPPCPTSYPFGTFWPHGGRTLPVPGSFLTELRQRKAFAYRYYNKLIFISLNGRLGLISQDSKESVYGYVLDLQAKDVELVVAGELLLLGDQAAVDGRG